MGGRSSSPTTVRPYNLAMGPQSLFGKRLGALLEPLDFNFLIASAVWLQAPGTQTDAGPCLPGGMRHPSIPTPWGSAEH